MSLSLACLQTHRPYFYFSDLSNYFYVSLWDFLYIVYCVFVLSLHMESIDSMIMLIYWVHLYNLHWHYWLIALKDLLDNEGAFMVYHTLILSHLPCNSAQFEHEDSNRARGWEELIILHWLLFFYSFPKRIGNGAWSRDGVTTTFQKVQEGNNTMVQCNSTHLTSFAVLSLNIDMAGAPVSACIFLYTHPLEPLNMYSHTNIGSVWFKLGRLQLPG